MGKEWLYWGGGKTAKRGRFVAKEIENNEAPPVGCMCAVLQLFDFNHVQLANLHHQSPLACRADTFLDDEPTARKGVEAPRNSLELAEPSSETTAPLSCRTKQDFYLNIPVGMQIKTRSDYYSKSPRDSTSECGSSPGTTKTPSLVARLMGLDLIPEASSPSLSTSSSRHSASNPSTSRSRLQHQGVNRHEDRARHLLDSKYSSGRRSSVDRTACSSGTRSLPDTPRVSSSSSRRSDVDHRFSLQINKENNYGDQEFDLSAYIAKKVAAKRREAVKQEDEIRSPRYYARQIVKQVKETVLSRRVGADITNTVKNRDKRKDENQDNVILLKPKKPLSSKTLPNNQTQNSNSPIISSPSLSPADNFQHTPQDKPPTMPKPKAEPKLRQQNNQQEKPSPKYEKVATERHKREEAFVVRSPSKSKANGLATEKACKKIRLSNELLQHNASTFLPVKKNHPSQPSSRLIDHNQSTAADEEAPNSKRNRQLAHRCQSQSSNQEATHGRGASGKRPDIIRTSECRTTTSSSGEAEDHEQRQYIQRILRRTGIDTSTPLCFGKWHSPSRPLDPSIFHHLELLHVTNNSKLIYPRSNRKLIFHLVDELLAEILKTIINPKPWVVGSPRIQQNGRMLNGSKLIDTLCTRIKAFPSANCQVLEDIDELIEQDLSRFKQEKGEEEEEEKEVIVSEIERDIVESVVHEMVVVVFSSPVHRRNKI